MNSLPALASSSQHPSSGWKFPDGDGDYFSSGPHIVFSDGAERKGPQPHLEDSSSAAQARRGKSSAATRWQVTERRDKEILYALAYMGCTQSEAASLIGISKYVVHRVSKRIYIDESGYPTLRMYA